MFNISAAVFGPIAHAFTIGRPDLHEKLCHINSAYVSSSDNHLPIDVTLAYRFFNEAFNCTGNPDIGLEAYNYVWPGYLGVPGYAVMSSSKLGFALERLAKYNALSTNGWEINVERHSNQFVVAGIPRGSASSNAPRCILDAGAALIIGLVHWLSPEVKPMPIITKLPYPKPLCTDKVKKLFGSNLIFDAEAISFTFDACVYDIPLITADSNFEEVHCSYADALVNEYVIGSFTARIRRAILDEIVQNNIPTPRMLALRLGKSKRALQKELEDEGVTFSWLYEDCRRELAYNLIADSKKSFKAIALMLGYCDSSSFYKACKRWFGASPGEVRKKPANII